jgi:DNA-binding HxlR family transcriptional regulator
MTKFLNDSFERSRCPVANALDLFGDKWSLLIVRDLMLGKTYYGEIAKSDERIPTNILANRLRRLEDAGILVKSVYCEKPVRYQYELTEKGRDLGPTLKAIADWGTQYVFGSEVFPKYN